MVLCALRAPDAYYPRQPEMTVRRKVNNTRRDEPLTQERAELVRAVGLAPERGVRYRIPTAELRRMVKSGQRIRVGRDPASRGANPTRRIRHTSMTFALDDALSEREYMLYKAANAAAYGEQPGFPEPNRPNVVEQHYINAIEAFFERRPTRGYDEIERGNHKALLRLGRSTRKSR